MKRISFFAALIACFSLAVFAGCAQDAGVSDNGQNGGTSASVSAGSNSDSGNTQTEIKNHKNLNLYFADATGKVSLNATMNMEIATNNSGAAVTLGGEGLEEIVIDGGGARSIKVKGSGGGCIQAANDGLLVLKNLKVENVSGAYSDSTQGFRGDYADFGGRVRFENCEITGAIQLHGNADVSFVDCDFISLQDDMYAVWMSQGKATFTGCSFTGYRAIKLYEGSDHYDELLPQYDVQRVVIDDCTFQDIAKKPGLAIDLMSDGETEIVIKNSAFNGCQNVKLDSYGLDGVYESHTQEAVRQVTLENVYVNGAPVDWDNAE